MKKLVAGACSFNATISMSFANAYGVVSSEMFTLLFLISCDVPKFSDHVDFCNVGICIPMIALEGVLSKCLESSKGFNISLSEVFGWVSFSRDFVLVIF